MNIDSIVDLDFGVFKDAYVRTVIIKFGSEEANHIEVLDANFALRERIPKSIIKKDSSLKINLTWTLENFKIFEKIKKKSIPLGEIVHFSRGIKTSNDKRFLFKEKINNEYYRIIRGRNIKAYQINFDNEFIWYRPDLMKEKIGSLPHTKELFLAPEKIITQRVNSSGQLLVTYDREQFFCLDTTNVSSKIFNDNYSLKFLVGIMNSKLINWWFNDEFKNPTISGYELHQIPIRTSEILNRRIENLVENVLTSKKNPEADTTDLENQIDQLVYELYELTEEEIEVIENA